MIRKATTCNKANRTKGFLQRNLHNCTPTIKDRLYKAMVKPIIEYAAVVWAPHTIYLFVLFIICFTAHIQQDTYSINISSP